MSDDQKTGDGLFSYKQPTNSEVSNMFAPDPDVVIDEPKTDKHPVTQLSSPVEKQQSTQINLTFDLPPARPAKRRRSSEKTFAQKHVTISLNVDKRIANDVEDFLERGAIQSGNKTVFVSQLLLQLLLNSGYKIDPNILANPE
jgi:hypothetical protein